MRSKKHGKSISEVEVTNISTHGFWLFVDGKEYFLSYDYFPWFENARINEISDVNILHQSHLYWKELDVDLEIDCLIHPEKYPLIYR